MTQLAGSVVAFHVDHGVPTIWAGTPAAAARIAERLMARYVAKRRLAGHLGADVHRLRTFCRCRQKVGQMTGVRFAKIVRDRIAESLRADGEAA